MDNLSPQVPFPSPQNSGRRAAQLAAQLSSGEGPGGRGCSRKGEDHQPTNPRTRPQTPRKTQFFCHCFGFPLCCCCSAHIMLRLSDGKQTGHHHIIIPHPSYQTDVEHNRAAGVQNITPARTSPTLVCLCLGTRHVNLASVDSVHTCTCVALLLGKGLVLERASAANAGGDEERHRLKLLK